MHVCAKFPSLKDYGGGKEENGGFMRGSKTIQLKTWMQHTFLKPSFRVMTNQVLAYTPCHAT